MNTRGRTSSLRSALRRRAWSRAGRVLDVVGRSPRRHVFAWSWRVAVHLTGCAVIAVGVGLMLWNDFGPGPLDVLIGAIRQHAGLPLTFALWLTTGSLLLVAWVLGRRPGLGNLITIAVIGPMMQLTVTVLSVFDAPSAFPAKVALHVVATAIVGLGAGMNLFARLGAGTSELLTGALATRVGRSEPRVRMACELTFLTLGVALGGPVGVGTVIVAVLIGPFVASGLRTVDTAVSSARVATRRQIESVRTPNADVAAGGVPVAALAAAD